MNLVYESEDYVIVWQTVDDERKNAFELVDKRAGEEVFLIGDVAERLIEQMAAWTADPPAQEEVDHHIFGLMQLGRFAMALH